MSISIANAIEIIKKDKQWLKKIIVGSVFYIILPLLFNIISIFLSGQKPSFVFLSANYLIAIICTIYAVGFIVLSANHFLNGNDYTMPEWFNDNIIKAGGKSFIGTLAWTCLTSLVSLLIFLIVNTVTAIILGAFNMLTTNPIMITILASIVATVILIVLSLYILQLFNIAYACFLKTLKLKELFDFGKHIKILKENQDKNWILIGKTILLSLLCLLSILALCVTIIGILLIPCLSFACYLIYYNLLVLYAKEIQIEKYI